MRYIKFIGGTGYCGTDFEEVKAFSDSTTDEELYTYSEELAHDNAAEYEMDVDGDYFEDGGEYFETAYCDWTEITEEEYKEEI